jgi:hypothetical protein
MSPRVGTRGGVRREARASGGWYGEGRLCVRFHGGYGGGRGGELPDGGACAADDEARAMLFDSSFRRSSLNSTGRIAPARCTIATTTRAGIDDTASV